MARWLYRVQDADGRGPYRPGFTRYWQNDNGLICLPWWEELGITLAQAVASLPEGMHSGCAFDSMSALARWFTDVERLRLDAFGYRVVRFKPDKIIFTTPTQVVFANRAPLAGLPVYC